MRPAAFTINGQGISGHWHETKLNVGDLYQMRRSGKWMAVETVYDGKFNPGAGESDGYFYSLRPATQSEIDEHLAPKPRMSEEEAERLFERINYIGS